MFNQKSLVLAILVIVIISGMSFIDFGAMKNSSVQADRSSVTSAASNYYQQKESLPLLDRPLKSFPDQDVAKLYKALAKKFTPEYVDANMFVLDTGEMKRAKSLGSLMDNDRKWITDKNDPTVILTPGDETNEELLATITTGDKSLASLTLTKFASTVVSNTNASALGGSNSVLLGGDNKISEIKWNTSKQLTEKDLTSRFVGMSSPVYIIKPNHEIHIVDSDGKILKGAVR